jgi:hypothetical protein
VQDYHKAFYRPDNLCLIINGKIQPEQVFPVLGAFEDKIVSKVRAAELTPFIITCGTALRLTRPGLNLHGMQGQLSSMERPWSSAVPPFETTAEVEIPFPADDEEIGEAMVGWRGPRYDVPASSLLSQTTLALSCHICTDLFSWTVLSHAGL